MIHTARQNGKFVKFVRRLRPKFQGCPVDVETVAVGLLERMWHLALECAKRGDIGRMDNETIAEAMGWFGGADEIIDLLVETKWLDICVEHRLVIHDWEEHVPGYIKRNISKQGGFVVAKHELDVSPDTSSSCLTPSGSAQAPTHNRTEHNRTIYRSID